MFSHVEFFFLPLAVNQNYKVPDVVEQRCPLSAPGKKIVRCSERGYTQAYGMIRYSKLSLGRSHPSGLLLFRASGQCHCSWRRSDFGEPYRSPMRLKVRAT